MHYIILTIANHYDEETHQGGFALYFKYMSKGKNVSWYDLTIDVNADDINVTITQRLMCTTTETPVYDRVSLYVISHSVGGTFAGFPAEILVSLLQGFLKYKVKVPTSTPVDKLCLIGCGTARGDNGANYVTKVGMCWRGPHPIKVIAWQAYVTLFDIRFLIRFITDAPQFKHIIDQYITACLHALENNQSPHASRLKDKLTTQLAGTITLHKAFKGFGADLNKKFIAKIQSATDQAILNLIGKKVIKLREPGNYFSTSPIGLPVGASTEGVHPTHAMFGDSRDATTIVPALNNAYRVDIAVILRSRLNQEIVDIILSFVADLFEWQFFPTKNKVSLLRHGSYGD